MVTIGEGRMRRNRIIVVAVAGALLLMTANPPSADIRILTHDVGDATPHRVQAAIDIGIVAISVLVTWTKRLV